MGGGGESLSPPFYWTDDDRQKIIFSTPVTTSRPIREIARTTHPIARIITLVSTSLRAKNRPAIDPFRLGGPQRTGQGTGGSATAFGSHHLWRRSMLKWALIFLVVGVLLGAMGFGGIGGAFVGIAKILFFVAIAIFLIFLVLALMAGRKVV